MVSCHVTPLSFVSVADWSGNIVQGSLLPELFVVKVNMVTSLDIDVFENTGFTRCTASRTMFIFDTATISLRLLH